MMERCSCHALLDRGVSGHVMVSLRACPVSDSTPALLFVLSANRACTSGIRKASTASSSAGVTAQSRARSSTTCHGWPSSDDDLVGVRASMKAMCGCGPLESWPRAGRYVARLPSLRSGRASRLTGLIRMSRVGGAGRAVRFLTLPAEGARIGGISER
jgi:hypothetical protein